MRAFVLIDARRGITDHDDRFLQLLAKTGASHQIILTKCDLLDHAKLVTQMANMYRQLESNKHYSTCYPFIIPTSSTTGHGIDVLLGQILQSSGLIERMVLLPREKKESASEREAIAYEAIKQYAQKKANESNEKMKKKKHRKQEKSDKRKLESTSNAYQGNILRGTEKKSIVIGLYGEEEEL